jgi:hypothetical protein
MLLAILVFDRVGEYDDGRSIEIVNVALNLGSSKHGNARLALVV